MDGVTTIPAVGTGSRRRSCRSARRPRPTTMIPWLPFVASCGGFCSARILACDPHRRCAVVEDSETMTRRMPLRPRNFYCGAAPTTTASTMTMFTTNRRHAPSILDLSAVYHGIAVSRRGNYASGHSQILRIRFTLKTEYGTYSLSTEVPPPATGSALPQSRACFHALAGRVSRWNCFGLYAHCQLRCS